MANILVVDDDAEIRELLCTYLGEAGLDAEGVADGEAMWRHLDGHCPDLIILDLMLPGTDGLTLCRSLRERSDIPVIMVTARGALIDRIVGLEMGADDYLPKPFDPRELLARIKVVLRRSLRATTSMEPAASNTLRFAGWALDTKRNVLSGSDGSEPLPIHGSTYLALRTLLDHPYRTLSRDYLAAQVFGRERDPSDRAIDMCISRLRGLLGDDPKNPRMIRTVRNGGYALTVDVAVA
ncbi:response regulator [Sphingomonas sp. AP4-R1]|uniref:response regulator n=1 Tax=Sphingomonas sp. AP4-R1 TaxID=2735134 RepID=UPI0014932B01|nr:response regulator [Sphingomonas sp. AP4-R1]QJU59985.1 response regulator [Sphingomonas sp. AP4-R1]